MCELCVLRGETEKLMREQQFRYIQYQAELNSDLPEEADRCRDRLYYLMDKILANFRKKRSLEIQADMLSTVVTAEHMN